jgi:pimeloyl-ACP methyl ester carboxylesterase
MQARPGGFDSLFEVADAVASYNPNRPPPSDLEGLRKNLRRGADGRWRWHWDPSFLAGDHAAQVAEMSRRMRAAAVSIKRPTLLVRGQASDVVSLNGVAELRQLIPHLAFVDVADAGHLVAGDCNDVFNAAITEFLGRNFPAC